MYRQPDCLNAGIGPLYPVSAVGGYHQIISRIQSLSCRIIFKLQTGSTGDNHHPFIMILIVPFIFLGYLSPGDDPLYAPPLGFSQSFTLLFCQSGGKISQYVVGEIHNVTPLYQWKMAGYPAMMYE